MSGVNKDAKFSLKVVVNKQKTGVLFAEIDSDFTDVLLSFLTFPLGTILRILKQHYGEDQAPGLGSLSSLYNGLSNLDSVHFLVKDTKSILLHPQSSSSAQCVRLKLDVSDCPPPVYFVCKSESCKIKLQCVSVYRDKILQCMRCYSGMSKEVAKEDNTESVDGVFTKKTASFLITDDLQILSHSEALLQIFSRPAVTAMDKTETMHITFGFSEVMDLLKASLISSTPLSDVILNKTGQMNYEESKTLSSQNIGNTSTDSTAEKKMTLKLMVQKSTNKLFHAQAEKDFVEFLFSFLIIPLGGVECLLGSNSSGLKSIDNLYSSTARLNKSNYYAVNNRLIKPKIPHGYVSDNHILPLMEESLYSYDSWSCSDKFPQGKGNYLSGKQTYKVMDDLTVMPFCYFSTISSFSERNIPLSDVKVMELQIGLEEALRILKASLTSKSALTDALLLNHNISNKQPKQEP